MGVEMANMKKNTMIARMLRRYSMGVRDVAI
jgi:hypothetical protein